MGRKDKYEVLKVDPNFAKEIKKLKIDNDCKSIRELTKRMTIKDDPLRQDFKLRFNFKF